jgi:hypothetical protein
LRVKPTARQRSRWLWSGSMAGIGMRKIRRQEC